MGISSRTPEGDWNRCPLCSHEVRLEPSQPFGDATCPHCGQLLWFIQFPSQTKLFDAQTDFEKKERAIKIIAAQLGIPEGDLRSNSTFFEDLRADSLDWEELVLEFEAELEAEAE